MEDSILCGCILEGNEVREVSYRVSTDDFIYKDENSGSSFVIDGLTGDKPSELKAVMKVAQKIAQGELGDIIGIVFLKECVLAIIDEDKAEFRNYESMTIPTGATVSIDLNCVDIAEETRD